MGCSGLLFNLGVKALLLQQQQSRVSLVCTMLLVVTYFFYCLTGLCDSAPRTLYSKTTPLDRDYYGDPAVDGQEVNNRRVLFDSLPPRASSPRLRAQISVRRWNETHAITQSAAADELSSSSSSADTQVDAAAGDAAGHQAGQQQGSEGQQQGQSPPPPPPGSSSVMPVANTFGTKKFPQAIIIGVKKGGTRALLEFLRIHPDVRAVGAEPHFFDRFYDKGLEWYRNLMPRTLDGQITMEKTPSYFVTKETPQRVCTLNPQTKLIVVVRDPVTRAVSDYTQTLSKNPGLPSFQSLALKNSSSSATGDAPIDSAWSAVRIGLYAKHLENWLRHFPLSHFLFVSGERLVSDPAGEMGRVQDFLGLKRVVSDKHFYFNQTKGFPCLKKPEGSSRPRCLGKSKGRPHPRIPSQVLQRLRDFYRPYNLRFYQMSGHDFGWD